MSGEYTALLWITFTFLTSQFLHSVETYQCIECQNCPTIGEDLTAFIKECGSPESFVHIQEGTGSTIGASTKSEGAANEIQSSTSVSPTTSGSDSTLISTLANDSSNSSSSQAPINNTDPNETTKHSSQEVQTTSVPIESVTEKKKVTSSWSMFPKSIEESDMINSRPEYDGFGTGRQSRQLCYFLKHIHEGKEIIDRGCGLSNQNEELTCKMLTKVESTIDCNVCEGELCNNATYGMIMISNAAGASSIGILFVLTFAAANVFK